MEDMELAAGDPFRLSYRIFNIGDAAVEYDVWILLGIGEEYWFYPAWIHMSEGLDFEPRVPIEAGSSLSRQVIDFVWPSGVGVIDGAQFIGAICVPGTYNIIGDTQTLTWGSL